MNGLNYAFPMTLCLQKMRKRISLMLEKFFQALFFPADIHTPSENRLAYHHLIGRHFCNINQFPFRLFCSAGNASTEGNVGHSI